MECGDWEELKRGSSLRGDGGGIGGAGISTAVLPLNHFSSSIRAVWLSPVKELQFQLSRSRSRSYSGVSLRCVQRDTPEGHT